MRYLTKPYLFISSVALILCSIQVNVLQAQVADVHIDACFNLDYFTNYGGVDIDVPDNGFAFRIGMNWKLEKYDNLTIGFEAGFSQRSVVRRLSGSKSEIRFRAIDFCPILTWQIYQDIKAEFGLGFSFYDPALYVNTSPKKLGDGYRNFDVYSAAGFVIDFHKYVSTGSRVRYGFIPALKYEPIGNYGEMDGEESILNQLTWEIFLRIKFYRLKDE